MSRAAVSIQMGSDSEPLLPGMKYSGEKKKRGKDRRAVPGVWGLGGVRSSLKII